MCSRNSFAQLVSEEYLKYFEFADKPLPSALRRFIAQLVLGGETQDRERLLSHFASRYHACNPNTYKSQGSKILIAPPRCLTAAASLPLPHCRCLTAAASLPLPLPLPHCHYLISVI